MMYERWVCSGRFEFLRPHGEEVEDPISCSLISHLPAPFLELYPYNASHCKAELTCSLSGICLIPATPILLTVQCGPSFPLCRCVLSVLTAPTVHPSLSSLSNLISSAPLACPKEERPPARIILPKLIKASN